MTERELIAGAAEGEEEAICALYERHAPMVLAVLRRLLRDEESARDCAQETWLRALRSIGSYRGESSFSTWLHRVAVTTGFESMRREGGRRGREVPLPPALPDFQKDGAMNALLRRRLEVALGAVPDGMREVLLLHDVEGFRHEEIAALLEISIGTSKSQLSRARMRMRELLGDEGERAGARNDHLRMGSER